MVVCGCHAQRGNAAERLCGNKIVDTLKPAKVSYTFDDYENWNKLLEENYISGAFKDALNQFAYKSGSRVLSAGSGNIDYSPISLYYALALAGCGSEGEMAGQIMDVLGIQEQSRLAEQCRKLYQWIYYYGEYQKGFYERYGEGEYNITVRLANSLWFSEQIKLKENYRNLAASQFLSSYKVDFTRQ